MGINFSPAKQEYRWGEGKWVVIQEGGGMGGGKAKSKDIEIRRQISRSIHKWATQDQAKEIFNWQWEPFQIYVL